MEKIKRPTINLSAPMDLKAKPETGARRFSIEAYTGKPLSSWFGQFVIDVAGMQLKKKVPILREHQRDRIVGFSDQVTRDGGKLVLDGSFSQSTQDAQEVLALADEGFPWQASMGVQPLQIKILSTAEEKATVNGREIKGPIEIWSKSLVGETSMVSWGRDNDTSMALLSQGEVVSVEIENQTILEGDGLMNLESLREKHPELYQQVLDMGAKSVELEAARTEARTEGVNLERARVTTILGVEGADAEAKQKAITDGIAADAAYKLFFEAERGKKAERLAELAAVAPGSIGHEPPKEPELLSGDVAKIVSDKAIALSMVEKIDLAEATKRVLAGNKELASKYYGQFTE